MQEKDKSWYSPPPGVKKTRIFYIQADSKGGGGSAPSALTISKRENFDSFFI